MIIYCLVGIWYLKCINWQKKMVWRWNRCWARFSFPKLRIDLGGLFVFPMVYSKDDNEVYIEQKVVRTAGAGLPLLIFFFYFMGSKHKIQKFALYKETVTRKMARYYKPSSKDDMMRSSWFCCYSNCNKLDQFVTFLIRFGKKNCWYRSKASPLLF